MTVASGAPVEFSRTLHLDRLARGDVEDDLSANANERAALAERFGLLGIDSLRGHLRVSRPGQGPVIRVEGELSAEVRQTCVVTLEPFDARVAESFVQLYTLEPAADDGEVIVSAEDEDTPEPLEGDVLDLGEVLAEQLALALDPHPRAPGVSFEGARFGGDEDDAAPEESNPFAVLKRLKNGG